MHKKTSKIRNIDDAKNPVPQNIPEKEYPGMGKTYD